MGLDPADPRMRMHDEARCRQRLIVHPDAWGQQQGRQQQAHLP
jgi:hypothetical protein